MTSLHTSSTDLSPCRLLSSSMLHQILLSSHFKPRIRIQITTSITSLCVTELEVDLRLTRGQVLCARAARSPSNWTWNMFSMSKLKIRTEEMAGDIRIHHRSFRAPRRRDFQLWEENDLLSFTCQVMRPRFLRARRRTRTSSPSRPSRSPTERLDTLSKHKAK